MEQFSQYGREFKLILASGGGGVIPPQTGIAQTPGSFRVQVPTPYDFRTGDWEVCLRTISFPHNPTINSNTVFVALNICELSPLNNDMVNILWHTKPMASTDPDPYYYEQTCTLLPWVNVKPTSTQQFVIELTYGQGVTIPNSTTFANNYTTIELVFRQKINSN